MPTWLLVPIYLAGLALVLWSANRLVTLCISISRIWGVKSHSLGSTVVAMATSLPEFAIVLIAVLAGKNDLAIGNILGANILNIGLVLGVSSLITPLEVSSTSRRRELPLALAVLGMFFLMAQDHKVGRPDGLVMLAAMGGYLWLHVRTAVGDVRAFRAENRSSEQLSSATAMIARTAVAVAALFAGGVLVVVAAGGLAEALGISQLTIGVVLVAMSTTLPELAASATSAYHKEPDISLANVIGSNNFNILVCVGFAALLKPVGVNPNALRAEFPAAFAFYVLLLALFLRRRASLGRKEGVLLLACYVLFVIWVLKG